MLPISSFSIARLPRIIFGAGTVTQVPEQIQMYGKRVLIVTGKQSFRASPHWKILQQGLQQARISWEITHIPHEPSPDLIDSIVEQYYKHHIKVVLGIGGGSTLDAAKAIAGLLPSGDSVIDYLEGVGKGRPYKGPSLPFIAVPTTAGTGSEATKNAVISVCGETGFKKSFRHDKLVAEVAIIDPDLLATCPKTLIAGNGMDAFTQLLESYVSTQANPITDTLAISGITAFRDSFFAVWENATNAQIERTHLAYASLLSGINLAQTGLGSVHGLAAPLGAFFPCPHGMVCGTLVAEATEINIKALQNRSPQNIALQKYAHIGHLLTQQTLSESKALTALVSTLRTWTTRLSLPTLDQYGMQATDITKVVTNARGNSMKTNPIELIDEELGELLQRRLK